MLDDLLTNLYKQRTPEVEILIDYHETDYIGKKRNTLLGWATGDYIVFIDDDDEIASCYVSKILNVINLVPEADCIGINGIITTDGKNKQEWFISKDYGRWFVRGNIYYRTPNHISPVKRELALKAGFPEVKFAEDYEYSMRLLPLLKSEIKIHIPIYHYKYVSNK